MNALGNKDSQIMGLGDLNSMKASEDELNVTMQPSNDQNGGQKQFDIFTKKHSKINKMRLRELKKERKQSISSFKKFNLRKARNCFFVKKKASNKKLNESHLSFGHKDGLRIDTENQNAGTKTVFSVKKCLEKNYVYKNWQNQSRKFIGLKKKANRLVIDFVHFDKNEQLESKNQLKNAALELSRKMTMGSNLTNKKKRFKGSSNFKSIKKRGSKFMNMSKILD